MSDNPNSGRLVAVIGAGPAGLYASARLLKAGCHVVLINRDIKPGGLVEYGVYVTKHRFKNGLRRQFKKTLDHEGLHYRGGVTVSDAGHVSLPELGAIGFDAVVVAVGAQGTKSLGLEGEEAKGVYHAKDLVYHYNRLPPFAEREYPVGKKVVIIGVGNVMVDIAHWLWEFTECEEILAVARAVPRFFKWTPKELKEMLGAIDIDGVKAEVERVRDRLEAAGEKPDEDIEKILKYRPEPDEVQGARWRVRWLVSPLAIQSDAEGHCTGLVVQELTPVAVDGGGRPKTRPLGDPVVIDADNVVFAIGDSVADDLGLVPGPWGYRAVSNDEDTEDAYRAADDNGDAVPNTYLVGWARAASTGLVGRARKDATRGAEVALADLERRPAPSATVADRLRALDDLLQSRQLPIIGREEIGRLEDAEQGRYVPGDATEGRFASNAEMLAAIDA